LNRLIRRGYATVVVRSTFGKGFGFGTTTWPIRRRHIGRVDLRALRSHRGYVIVRPDPWPRGWKSFIPVFQAAQRTCSCQPDGPMSRWISRAPTFEVDVVGRQELDPLAHPKRPGSRSDWRSGPKLLVDSNRSPARRFSGARHVGFLHSALRVVNDAFIRGALFSLRTGPTGPPGSR